MCPVCDCLEHASLSIYHQVFYQSFRHFPHAELCSALPWSHLFDFSPLCLFRADMGDEDHDFAGGDAGASDTFPMQVLDFHDLK